MGIGLAELGKEMAQEIEQRQKELQGIIDTTSTKLKSEKKERTQQNAADLEERKEALVQLWQKIYQLLSDYRKEAVSLQLAINEERSAGKRELVNWIKDGQNQVKTWHDSLNSRQRKRGRR